MEGSQEPGWAKDFPRLYELYCDSDQDNEENYFDSLDEFLKNLWGARAAHKRSEEELQQLVPVAWDAFKQKVSPYVTSRDERRGWNQLVECFNEVKGYLYLKSQGCEDIQFIPEESNSKSPDLKAHCGSSVVLLEVKTVNQSDDEIKYISGNSEIGNDGVRKFTVREIHPGLNDHLKSKIIDAIVQAKNQFIEYTCDGVRRRIAYLVIRLDYQHARDSRDLDELAAFIDKQSGEEVEVRYYIWGV